MSGNLADQYLWQGQAPLSRLGLATKPSLNSPALCGRGTQRRANFHLAMVPSFRGGACSQGWSLPVKMHDSGGLHTMPRQDLCNDIRCAKHALVWHRELGSLYCSSWG